MRAWSNMHRGKAPGCKPYSRRGFTLIELMVSLAGGLFLSITVFLVAKHTSALYQRETRIASTNVASVVGFERLRADLARAGFMSSPHIRRDPFVCGNPVGNAAWPVQLREMTSVRIDNIPEANLPNVLVDNGITPQTLLLSGNYSSAEAFPARAIVVSGTSFQIFLQQATGAMARIGYGAPGADNQAILTSVFPPGRAIRVVDNSGRSQFGTLTSVSTNPSPVLNIAGGQPNLIFRTSSTMGCGFKGEETGALVNAVNFFRYDLRNLSTDSRYAPLYPDPDTEVGPEYEDERTDLVREEIGPNGTAIPNTLELVTEYAVDLRFRLTVAPNQRSQLQYRLVATGDLQEHLLISLRRALAGLALGVGAGVSLAIVAGLWRMGENLVDATMQMLRAMPILALVPLAIVWFGIGEEVKVILVALGVTFPMYLNTHAAIRSVDSRYVDLATTVGLGQLGLVRRVVLPGALPGFFTGLRFAVAISWLVLVVSEQINAASGIGFLMSQARGFNQTDIIVVGLVVYALLGLTSDTVVRAIERRALTWRSTLEAR